MSGLLFLQTEDFSIQKGVKGNILCHSIRGLSLLLFYSTNCQHCRALIPIFKRLPGQLGGCQFGMINVSMQKNIIAMSKATISEIKYVPLIILYVAGKPFIRYDGPHDENEIKRFILEVSSKIQSKEKFSNKEVPRGKMQANNGKKEVPAYASGQPLWGDSDDFYMEFAEAYT
jgi:thioredoxin-like negative regulator of GroEL